MTAEMPRTKPNIMMTARLLLMPVLRSVELKPPNPCANAERVLRRSIAATMSTEPSRERTWGVSFLLSFIALMFVVSSMASGLFPLNHAHIITNNACREDVAHTQNAQPVRGSGKGMNTRTDSAKLAKLQEL